MTRPIVESYTSGSSEIWMYQLEMASALGKAWIDAGNYNRAEIAFQDAETYDSQLETSGSMVDMDKIMYQAGCRLKFYMFKAELEIQRDDMEKAKSLFTSAVG
ncbi:hypothetical protein INT45_012029 [Circinella minor]|uniref:Uncharacterized protein n=1 Tax=Circinella minor TaxID=1195481 RepID=A0A8H7VP97_9FUNG|nr:hypothetical protein INT45_012029 [Circinella minor]